MIVVYANKVAEEWFGPLLGNQLATSLAKFDVEKCQSKLEKNRPYTYEVDISKPNGSIIPIEITVDKKILDGHDLILTRAVNISKIREKDAMMKGFLKTIDDNNKLLTRQKNLIEKKYQELELILNNLKEGICVLNLDFTIKCNYTLFLEKYTQSNKLDGMPLRTLFTTHLKMNMQEYDDVQTKLEKMIQSLKERNLNLEGSQSNQYFSDIITFQFSSNFSEKIEDYLVEFSILFPKDESAIENIIMIIKRNSEKHSHVV